jgi:hypothetical protein
MAKSVAEVPLREALESTGTPRKMWRDLLEAGLMDPARRGSQNTWVVTSQQYQRLESVARARKRIDGRFTLGKLAFELADEGCRWVPTELVQKEITIRIDSLFGFWRRWLQRYLGLPPRFDHVIEPEIMEAAKKFALRATRKMPKRYRFTAYDAVYVFLAMSLKMMYLKRSNPLDYARILKELVYHTGAVDHLDKGHIGFSFQEAQQLANQIASSLIGLSTVLSFNKSVNILFTARSKSILDADFWKAFDAGRRVSSVVWEAYDELRQFVKLDQFSEPQRAKIRPLIIGMILAFQAHPPKESGLILELLSGDERTLKQILGQLIEAARHFLTLQPLLATVPRRQHVA